MIKYWISLQELDLKPQNDATIFVDPTSNGIRIYGKWKNSYDFGITKELFDAYDNIAGHIKKLSTVDT